MTFRDWINEKGQEDIRSKLKEQNYEDYKEVHEFFNDRIRYILGTHYMPVPKLKSSTSYERRLQDNRDYEKNWYAQKFSEEETEKKTPIDKDIEFGETEQKFFRKMVEFFPTSKELKEIENDRWEKVLSSEKRAELFITVNDLLNENENWIKMNYSILGWTNSVYCDVEEAIREKFLFPHMYRIRYCLSRLKNNLDSYAELSGKEFIKKEQAFEVALDRYITIVDERAEKEKFANRINQKMKRIQQLLYGLNQETERVKDVSEITEEDKLFEADLDRYLNILDERKAGNKFETRIMKKIEHIEKAWSWYEIEKKVVDQGKLKAITEYEFIENEDTIERYYKMGMKGNNQEDDIFEEKLKKFERFVWNEVKKAAKPIYI